jgi:hypothetical protein
VHEGYDVAIAARGPVGRALLAVRRAQRRAYGLAGRH